MTMDFTKPDPPERPTADKESPPPVPTTSGGIGEETWSMITHLSSLAAWLGAFFGLNVILPLIFWLIRRDQSAMVEEHGKEAVNFNISLLIWFAVIVAGCIVTLGVAVPLAVPLAIGLGIAHILCTILAALAAKDGRAYRYPLTIRMIK